MKYEPQLRTIITESVTETLSGLGFDLTQRQQLQADLLYLRRKRMNDEDWARRFRQALMTLFIPAIASALWYGLVALLDF